MDGTNDDNNDNTEEQSKNEAIWKLLSLYKDRFSSDEDYVEYARTVQRATGASDQIQIMMNIFSTIKSIGTSVCACLHGRVPLLMTICWVF